MAENECFLLLYIAVMFKQFNPLHQPTNTFAHILKSDLYNQRMCRSLQSCYRQHCTHYCMEWALGQPLLMIKLISCLSQFHSPYERTFFLILV